MVNARAANINQLWANLIIEELYRLGIDTFVLSPGSRCSPLTVAVATDKRVHAITHFDERGSAFYALGHARATGKPAALICTSGTATANYYPAIVEASMDMVPMLALTADRPSELRNTGANQTINQVKLYGKYTRFFHDLPAPDAEISPENVLTAVDEAMSAAMKSPRGPVHINCQFREPLAPTGVPQDFSKYLSNIRNWLDGSRPFLARQETIDAITESQLTRVASLINKAKSGLLMVGALNNDHEIKAVTDLATRLKWPVFADIRSGLRSDSNNENVIDYFDQLLLSDEINRLTPDLVLHFGSLMTSKRLNEYIAVQKCQRYVHVASHPLRHDPAGVVTDRVEADIAEYCPRLCDLIETGRESLLTSHLVKRNRIVGKIMEDSAIEKSGLTEIAVARLISKHIVAGTGLFLGSSMPIRDMDMYADPRGSRVNVTANRGASGIDGAIATAAGYADGLKRPVTALIGDLAFLHDINSLNLLRDSRYPVILIVINNNGGGIFSFLPIHECADVFEKYFGTPHGLTFEKFAEAFALDYLKPESVAGFLKAYEFTQRADKSSIIEITTERESNRMAHAKLQEQIRSALSSESN